MMTGKERVQTVLSHREADRIALDFGATAVTGIHVKKVAEFRRHYGLKDRPVKVVSSFFMLGEIDDELIRIWNVDCIGVRGQSDAFGHKLKNAHSLKGGIEHV